MKLFAILACLMLVAGCVSAGVRVEEKNLTSFEKGRTSYGEVIAKLGQPTTNALLPDGRRMLIYSWMQAQARPESFIPIVGSFVGGADSRFSTVTIYLDSGGKLESYSASQSQIGAGNGLAAGSSPGRIPNQPRAQSSN